MAGGAAGRLPPSFTAEAGDSPLAGLLLRAGRGAGRGWWRRALPSPPWVFVEGETALPSLRERQPQEPAAGRGALTKH